VSRAYPGRPATRRIRFEFVHSIWEKCDGSASELLVATQHRQTKPNVHAGIRGRMSAAVGGTAIACLPVKAASTNQTGVFPLSTSCIFDIVVFGWKSIKAPFPHVPVHIEQAARIGTQVTSGVDSPLRIHAEPRVTIKHSTVTAKCVRSPRATSPHKFPLGLREKTKTSAFTKNCQSGRVLGMTPACFWGSS
jgi:hypothetical protein